MRIVSFRGVNLSAHSVENSMPVSGRSSLLALPNGSYDQDGNDLVLRSGKISFRGLVKSNVDTTIDTLITALAKGRGIIRVLMRDGTTYRQTWAKLTNLSRERKIENIYHQPVVFEFDQDFPFWIATADEPYYLDDGNVLDDDWSLDAGQVTTQTVTASPTSFTIINQGTVIVTRGTITISTTGNISQFKLENITNGKFFRYAGTLSSGDVLVIDLLTKTITLNGDDCYSSLVVCDKSEWMSLITGTNVLQITGHAITGTTTVQWRWAKHYL